MCTVTAAEVKAYAPELSAVDDLRVDLFVGFAGDFVSPSQFGLKCKHAKILMACHLLTIANRGGTGGGVTSEKVGDLQVSYGSMSTNDALDTTSYGQTFKALRRTIKTTPIVV